MSLRLAGHVARMGKIKLRGECSSKAASRI